MNRGRRSPYRRLAVFLALAYGMSWWPWPLSDLDTRPDAALMIPVGPSIAALLVLGWTAGRRGVRALLCSAVHVRIGRWWLATALPAVVAAVAAGLAVTAGATPPTAGRTAEVLAAAAISLPILLVLGGPLGEELGWRGYALTTLTSRLTPVTATLALIPMWLVFHLPWIIHRPERYGLAWALTVTGLAFTMTWLQVRTRSLALAVVFHTVVNTSAAVTVQSFPEADRPLVWNLVAALWLILGVALAAGPLRSAARSRPGPPADWAASSVRASDVATTSVTPGTAPSSQARPPRRAS